VQVAAKAGNIEAGRQAGEALNAVSTAIVENVAKGNARHGGRLRHVPAGASASALGRSPVNG